MPDVRAAPRRPLMTATLPSVTCTARSLSEVLPHDTENTAYVLRVRVIWFQDDGAIPIDTYVLSRLTVFEWERHAVGWLP